MGKRFACHKISEGAAQAEAIISKDRIMFYQVRPEDGVMTEKDHCLEGQVIAGKVLLSSDFLCRWKIFLNFFAEKCAKPPLPIGI